MRGGRVSGTLVGVLILRGSYYLGSTVGVPDFCKPPCGGLSWFLAPGGNGIREGSWAMGNYNEPPVKRYLERHSLGPPQGLGFRL